MNCEYMYENTFTSEYRKLMDVNYELKEYPTLIEVNNAFILPLKKCNNYLSWGCGGVLNEDKEYISISGVKSAFGGGIFVR